LQNAYTSQLLSHEQKDAYTRRNVIEKLIMLLPGFGKHPISRQSSLKYLGVILDDKLNCKLQIETLVTQLSKSYGMLFKLKHYTNNSVLKSVYFALFHSYSTYSIFNWGRANKTTLLPLIR